eukprot:363196-Chlamydomonas_euryale.AAC.5
MNSQRRRIWRSRCRSAAHSAVRTSRASAAVRGGRPASPPMRAAAAASPASLPAMPASMAAHRRRSSSSAVCCVSTPSSTGISPRSNSQAASSATSSASAGRHAANASSGSAVSGKPSMRNGNSVEAGKPRAARAAAWVRRQREGRVGMRSFVFGDGNAESSRVLSGLRLRMGLGKDCARGWEKESGAYLCASERVGGGWAHHHVHCAVRVIRRRRAEAIGQQQLAT